ncbi:MAG TPA: HEAT repeat domain-containing protein [Gemmataceae bacterium]|jgi:HEAT repeat protein|nr:HEAT repeat domain-containing protein [Gemmataceae bacterium]
MGLSFLRRAPRTSRTLIGLAGLAILLLASAPVVRADDPVDNLRIILGDRSQGDAAGIERLDFRRAKVKEAIDQMKTIGQLRRALVLDEWKVDPKRVISPELRDLDNEMRSIVGNRLTKALKKAAEKGDANARLAVANTIAEMGPTIRPLNPNDPKERFGYARTLLPIVVHLTRDDDLGVRQEALRALSNINADPKDAAEVFRGTLQKDPQIGPRRLAADGLEQMVKVVNFLQRRGQAGSGVDATREDLLRVVLAVGPVAAVALEDSDVEVRMLGLMAVQQSAQTLSDLMEVPTDFQRKDFPPVGFKLSALEKERILDKYNVVQKDFAEVKPILDMLKKVMPTYGKTLYDPDARVRLAAAQAFDNLSNARIRIVRRAINLPTLRDLKNNIEKTPQTLLQGTDFMAPFFARDLPQLGALLRDPDVRIRRAAAEVLEELEEKNLAIMPALVSSLSDPDRFVRWTACKAAGTLPPDQAEPVIAPLARLLADPELNIRISAAASLEAMGKYARPALPALGQAIRSGEVEARLGALYAIIKTGPEASAAVVPDLIVAINGNEPRVTKVASEALADIGPAASAALPSLRRLIGNDDSEVRSWASEAILSILRNE